MPNVHSALGARAILDLSLLNCGHAGSGSPAWVPVPHPLYPPVCPPLPRCLYPQVTLPSTRPHGFSSPFGPGPSGEGALLCALPWSTKSVAPQLLPRSCCPFPFPVLLLLCTDVHKVYRERMDPTSGHGTRGSCGPQVWGDRGRQRLAVRLRNHQCAGGGHCVVGGRSLCRWRSVYRWRLVCGWEVSVRVGGQLQVDRGQGQPVTVP